MVVQNKRGRKNPAPATCIYSSWPSRGFLLKALNVLRSTNRPCQDCVLDSLLCSVVSAAAEDWLRGQLPEPENAGGVISSVAQSSVESRNIIAMKMLRCWRMNLCDCEHQLSD